MASVPEYDEVPVLGAEPHQDAGEGEGGGAGSHHHRPGHEEDVLIQR